MSKKQLTIWFNKNGDMIATAGGWYVNNANQSGYQSELAQDFDDTLVFHKMFEYKTARVYFRSKKNGRYYCMFLDDFSNLLRLGLLVNNELTGRFSFTKRGQGQGIKMILRSADQFRLEKLIEESRQDDRSSWF